MGEGLPEYARPPVVEVALSVQFEPVANLTAPHLGLFWQQYRDRFPRIEEHVPIPPTTERFGARWIVPPVTLQLSLRELPSKRLWALNHDGTELVQIQPDRFGVNWRNAGSPKPYPRYINISSMFFELFDAFRNFVHREQLGDIGITQCEVVYVNQIPATAGFGDVGQVFAFISRRDIEFLPQPEHVRANLNYIMHRGDEPIGRLHVAVEPSYKDENQIFLMRLTARGTCDGSNDDGIRAFFDAGHEWIVRGFTALTTDEMHAVWERMK